MIPTSKGFKDDKIQAAFEYADMFVKKADSVGWITDIDEENDED
jgi:hypothetical protein